MQIIRHRFFGSTCHHFRLILKRTASESTKNYHFSAIQCGNIQNPCQSLLMDFKKFSITDLYSVITIILIEPIAWSFP